MKAVTSVVAPLLFVAVLCGCEQDEIAHYWAPKSPPAPITESRGLRVRMLAAIIPRPQRTWFFKFEGPENLVAAQQKTFEQLIRSVRFSGAPAKPITWTTPEGWQEEGPSGSRLATLRVTAGGEFAELTVTQLGVSAAPVLPNVNRWRRQLGLGPIAEGALAKNVRNIKTAAGMMTLVDLEGTAMQEARPASREQMIPSEPANPAEPVVAAGPPPGIQYNLPPGWTRQSAPDSMAVAAFQASGKDGIAKVTIVPLPGPSGNEREDYYAWLLANFNRWQGQVGLVPTNLDDLRHSAEKLEVDGEPSVYVKLYGPDSAGPQRKGLLGVITLRDHTGWFVTMKGTAAAVAAEEDSFGKFARSLHFGSATPQPTAADE